MKHIKLFSFLFMCLVAVSCSAQKILSEVSNIKGVTSVYVGKSMLKLAGAISPGGADEKIDMSKLTSQLNSIEIVTCDNKKAIEQAEPLIQKALKAYPLEIITEVNEDGEKVEISGVFKDDGTITLLVIKSIEPNEINYVLLKGNISSDVLESSLQN